MTTPPVASAARILIIEDNEDLAFGLRRSLEGEGYHVYIAPDGAAALAHVQTERPDLALLDLMLPGGMDGYKTLTHFRNSGFDFPILILTARGEESDKVHGFRLGADDYVVKPFGLSELLARECAASSCANAPASGIRSSVAPARRRRRSPAPASDSRWCAISSAATGGDVAVSDAPSGGARFIVTFARAEPQSRGDWSLRPTHRRGSV